MLYKTIEAEQKYRNILSMVKEGMTKNDICKRLNINEQTYYKYMQKAEQVGHLKKQNYIVLPSFDEYLKENDIHAIIEKIINKDLCKEENNNESRM